MYAFLFFPTSPDLKNVVTFFNQNVEPTFFIKIEPTFFGINICWEKR
jgi:hypothetical protein